MKYLIVGLGNMDIEYEGTRHNVGFEVINRMIESKELTVKHERLGDLAVTRHRGRTLYLLKPSTYMNRSGKAINYWLEKLNIKQENLLVIVDDLNIDFGRIRIRSRGSDGGHNGLKDIQQYIGTQYARIRIGIGDSFHQGQQVNYVLGKWTEQEKDSLSKTLKKCVDAIYDFSFRGIQQTMNQYNN
jgi:PTH1 family peptidyl-tRNA hydrolase